LNHRPVRLLIIFTLAFIVSCPVILPRKAYAQNNEYYSKTFAWNYDGTHWTWNLSIPKSLYDAYKAVPVSTRTRNGPEGYGFLTTTNDHYLRILAEKLNETTTHLGYSSYDQVSFVLAFVQSLPYTSDNVTEGYNEYPRFPIETLVDEGGDCEDTSILFASLTLILGYGTVYINPPDHYAVGILGNDLKGTYWTYNNKTYYYCETTGNGFKIGQLPDQFEGQSAYVYSIDQSKQFVPDVVVTPTVEPTPTDSPVTTLPTPTFVPNPTVSPTVAEPTIQPVLPLSFNLISDNPLLFIIIVFAIVVSIIVAVKSAKKPEQPRTLSQAAPPQEPSAPPTAPDDDVEGSKFCIYCGSSNKAYAVYCESCGKKIG
jgi:hypothetical protein